MPDFTRRPADERIEDEEVLDMPDTDEGEGVKASAHTTTTSDDQGVLRIALPGLRTAIAVINQLPEK